MGIDQLLAKAGQYLKPNDLDRIRKAYEFADQAHAGQVRKSGEPYILHPLAVAEILVDMQLDATTLEAALLHDVVEDTTVTLEDVRETFGFTCAMLVDGVTKLEKIKFKIKGRTAKRKPPQNDRGHGAGLARHFDQAGGPAAQYADAEASIGRKQREIADETLEIFVPWRIDWGFCD